MRHSVYIYAVLPRDNKMGAQKTYRASDSFICCETIIGTAYFGTEERRLICVSVQLYIADFVSTYTRLSVMSQILVT